MLGGERSGQLLMNHPQSVICATGSAMQQQNPCGLQILDVQNFVGQLFVFRRDCCQLRSHESGVTQRSAEALDPLLFRREPKVPTPHNGGGVCHSSNCCQPLTSCRSDSCFAESSPGAPQFLCETSSIFGHQHDARARLDVHQSSLRLANMRKEASKQLQQTCQSCHYNPQRWHNH